MPAPVRGDPDFRDFRATPEIVDVPTGRGTGDQVVAEPGTETAGSEGASDIGITAIVKNPASQGTDVKFTRNGQLQEQDIGPRLVYL